MINLENINLFLSSLVPVTQMQEAMAIIQAAAGSQLDPEVVKIFQKIY